MAISKISANEFATRISESVNNRDSSIDTSIGPIRDVFIDPFSDVLENQNDRILYLNSLLSLRNASSLVPDDIDDVVSNENLVRWQGSRSIVTLTFSRTSDFTSDYTVPVNFPVSTITDPSTGNIVSFKTVETKTMTSATMSRYYNPDTKQYELNVLAASIPTGITTQIGANTITIMMRRLDGFTAVTNKAATSNGKSIESNEDLAKRYFLHVEGAQIGTPAGLHRFILDNISGVTDAYIVYGTNTSLTRQSSDAGAIDIWVLGETALSSTYSTYYNGVETLNAFPFQPVIRVSSVISGGVAYTEGDDFDLITGVGDYAYSNSTTDGIKWLTDGSHVKPAIGDSVTIIYEYNSLINLMDSYFKQEEYYEGGSDRLFRWAQEESIEIEANLKVRSGNPSSIVALVRTAVTDYVNALRLGDNLEEFDIDAVVAGVYGVDNWTYVTLAVSGAVSGTISDIEIDPNKYARLANADLVINLV